MKPLARLALLLALLPQLLVLGLGVDLVLCFAPGGHVEFEVAASGCCGAALVEHGGVEEAAGEPHDDPCGPCRDLPVLVDSGETARTAAATPIELPAARPALEAFASRVVALVEARSTRVAAPRPPERAPRSRSVVMRC